MDSVKIRDLLMMKEALERALPDYEGNRSALTFYPLHTMDKLFADFNALCPGLIPQFDSARFHRLGVTDVAGVRNHIALALGAVKAELQGVKEEASRAQSQEFSFVGEPRLKAILKRDYVDIQKCIELQSWKAVMILSGGAIEALLLDSLQKNPKSVSSSKAPKGKVIEDWRLNDLIEVAEDLKLIEPGVHKLSHSVRDYRNLVHPSVEIGQNLTVAKEEARIAVEVLNMLIRDLQN